MYAPKHSAKKEYRLRQREQIEASPSMTEKFPRLKGLEVTLEFFDSTGTIRNGEMKCNLNVARGKSALWFDCPGPECLGGDFDLSEALAKAVVEQRKAASGELRCHGTRTHGDCQHMPCETLLRYRFNLNYD